MLVVKLVEKPDGTIVAETPRKVIGQFKNSTRPEVIEYLTNKAREVGEDITFVDEFRPQSEEHVNWEKLIKKHY